MKTMLISKAPLGAAFVLPLVLLVVVPLALRGQPGLVDPDFNSRLPVIQTEVTTLALQSDGKILVGGNFAAYPKVNGQEFPFLGLARLNADGTVDTNFANFEERGLLAMAVQNDDKIVAGGYWWTTNAAKHANICRLNSDGSIDSTFDPGPGTDWRPTPTTPSTPALTPVVRTLAIQADGKILLGGDFTQVVGERLPALARLNPDGSVDHTFQPPTRAGDQVQKIVLQPDGKLILGVTFNGSFPPRVSASVLRLNSDGTVDATFQQSADLRRSPLALQKNGKLVAALFPSDILNLSEPVRLVRLNPDGTRDPGFAATVSLTNVAKPFPSLFAIVAAPGGKAILLGKFNRVNGVEQNDLARLNPDGSVDTTFQSGSGFESPPSAQSGSGSAPLSPLPVKIGPALLQSDGKILFGGVFGKVNGAACQSVARLLGDPPLRFLNVRLSIDGILQSSLSGETGNEVSFEASSDLKNWTRVSAVANRLGVPTLDIANGGLGSRFYRAIAE